MGRRTETPLRAHHAAPGRPAIRTSQPARVAPGGPAPPIYEKLIEELRDELSEVQEEPVPVFPFGYDWRIPLESTEKRLAAFVCEVIDRTRLVKHHRSDSEFCKDPTVNLIGHSMGGLIIAGCVERYCGMWVDKVVTLASPFQARTRQSSGSLPARASSGRPAGHGSERMASPASTVKRARAQGGKRWRTNAIPVEIRGAAQPLGRARRTRQRRHRAPSPARFRLSSTNRAWCVSLPGVREWNPPLDLTRR